MFSRKTDDRYRVASVVSDRYRSILSAMLSIEQWRLEVALEQDRCEHVWEGALPSVCIACRRLLDESIMKEVQRVIPDGQ